MAFKKLSTGEIIDMLNSIQSDEHNQAHFIELGKSTEIALISTDSELFKIFKDYEKENNLKHPSIALYVTGDHKELIINAIVSNYDKNITEKRNNIKNGL